MVNTRLELDMITIKFLFFIVLIKFNVIFNEVLNMNQKNILSF